MAPTRSADPSQHIERMVARGVTLSALERALELSPGYLSKVRHGAVTAGRPLALLLSLLARHGPLLDELGVRPRPKAPVRRPAAPAGRGGASLALLRQLAPELDAAGVRWAIGGGLALAQHGLVRSSQDVDVFLHDGDRRALELLRSAGASVGKVTSTAFIAFPRSSRAHADHIDLVFVTEEPLRGAVRRAQVKRVGSAANAAELPFVRALDLCVLKLLSHSEKDGADARALIEAKRVDPARVRAALKRVPKLPKNANRYARFHRDTELAARRLREATAPS